MAVGNGEVWITDNGSGNIAIGDNLITSSVAGYAMRDAGQFDVSHVFAKTTEVIDWSTVTEEIDGVKVAKVNVIFSVYDKNNLDQSLQVQSMEVIGNALFGSNLQIAGSLNVSGNTTLTNLTVTGTTQLANLTVTGTATIANLKVTGMTEVADIKVNGKIITQGNVPVTEVLGTSTNLAEAAVAGTDVAGTITLATDIIAPVDGKLKLVFNASYDVAPIVTITGVGLDGAKLGAYVESTTENEVIVNFINAPDAEKEYRFNYQIIQAVQTN